MVSKKVPYVPHKQKLMIKDNRLWCIKSFETLQKLGFERYVKKSLK